MRRVLAASIVATGWALAAPSLTLAAGDTAPVVKVHDPGADPKQEVRFHFQEGDTQQIQMTMRLTMTQSMGGNDMPAMSMPALSIPVTSTIVGVDEKGAAFEMVLGAVSTDAADASPMASMFAGAMKQLEGMKITGVVDDRGQKHDIKVDSAAASNPQLAGQVASIRNSLTQMTPPLPEEPIGAGATWSYVLDAESNGVAAQNTTTIKLVHRDANALALKMNIAVHAEPQQITSPGMPPGAELLGMDGKGTGDSTILLNRLFPSAMEGKTNVKVDIKAKMGQTDMTISQTVDMLIEVEPAKS
ncbi:MAG: hypothetical protein KDA20_01555 [Phycisphaerales bacterium]|nr:hypothetical protein [Phycisphaerales bacterium]